MYDRVGLKALKDRWKKNNIEICIQRNCIRLPKLYVRGRRSKQKTKVFNGFQFSIYGIEEKNFSVFWTVYGNKCCEIKGAHSLLTSCRSLHKIQAKWRFVCLSKWHRIQKIPLFLFFCFISHGYIKMKKIYD